jgi:phosphoribosylformylglycinamidine (FGAM) synthase PurS component
MNTTINLALDDQREIIASWVADMCQGLDANTIAEAIRRDGNE